MIDLGTNALIVGRPCLELRNRAGDLFLRVVRRRRVSDEAREMENVAAGESEDDLLFYTPNQLLHRRKR